MFKHDYFQSEDGQAVVEYAAILGIVILAVVAAVMLFGIGVGTLYSGINSAI